MSQAYNNIYNGKSKHINNEHGYIQKLITNRVITIVHVKFVNYLADPLIKELLLNKYRIIYQLNENTVNILRVIHGARLLDIEI